MTVLHGHRVVSVTVDGLAGVVPVPLGPPLDRVVAVAGVALLAGLPAEAADTGLVADTLASVPWHRRQRVDTGGQRDLVVVRLLAGLLE